MKNSLKLPDGWKLFDSKEKEWKNDKYFFNKYVHRKSESGIVYYSSFKGDREIFVVEGYGIGTIDPDSFKEISDIAPIERFELFDEEKADKALIDLMNENLRYWRKYSEK